VDLTIIHPNPVTGRPLGGSVATFLKDKGEQKFRKSADSCGRMEFDFSPRVFDKWGDSRAPALTPALGPPQMCPLRLWVPLPTHPTLQQLLNLYLSP